MSWYPLHVTYLHSLLITANDMFGIVVYRQEVSLKVDTFAAC